MTGSSRLVIGLKGLRVKGAASHRGCCGCTATRRRGKWTRECPTCGKVPRRVCEVFSAGLGSEVSELSFARKCWSRSKALDAVVRPLHEPSLVRLQEERSMREVSYLIFELRENTVKYLQIKYESESTRRWVREFGRAVYSKAQLRMTKSDVGDEWVRGSKD